MPIKNDNISNKAFNYIINNKTSILNSILIITCLANAKFSVIGASTAFFITKNKSMPFISHFNNDSNLLIIPLIIISLFGSLLAGKITSIITSFLLINYLKANMNNV